MCAEWGPCRPAEALSLSAELHPLERKFVAKCTEDSLCGKRTEPSPIAGPGGRSRVSCSSFWLLWRLLKAPSPIFRASLSGGDVLLLQQFSSSCSRHSDLKDPFIMRTKLGYQIKENGAFQWTSCLRPHPLEALTLFLLLVAAYTPPCPCPRRVRLFAPVLLVTLSCW